MTDAPAELIDDTFGVAGSEVVRLASHHRPVVVIDLILPPGMDEAWIADFAAGLAVASAALGLVVERWLFFAEAKHTVTLYYGAEAV
jgi:DMSO reductase anchor subunit